MSKHRTVIGDGVHLGSDKEMVAHVTLGAGARTGAGAVVVNDVPAGATVVGVPARVLGGARAADVPDGTAFEAASEGGHPA